TSLMANRMSYLFDFHGPSAVVDTACSSSLVALHRALHAVRTGACDTALAGGVNLMISPLFHASLQTGSYLSPDGRCKTFDASADGYVRGEGVGLVLLRPLSRAMAEGDPIHALILGSAENHGGRTNSLTAPSVEAQKELLVSAYDQAGVDPASVNYIEVHGTGTKLGDPIEINALKEAFAALDDRWGHTPGETPRCGLGALKTQAGHLEAAAGIAGVLKVILALKHRRLPGILHLEERNPYLQLGRSPFRIVEHAEPWERVSEYWPRRAGVSSFGFGGSNAHVVLEEFDAGKPAASSRQPTLIVLSAKNEERLIAYAEELLRYDGPFDGLAYTLQVGREAMEERVAWVVHDLPELKERLADFVARREDPQALRGRAEPNRNLPALTGEEGDTFVLSLARSGRWHDLAGFWILGCVIEWNRLYENPPARVHAPTYPFAPERYWLPGTTTSVVTETELHPLVQREVASSDGQRFVSDLRGEAFYLEDHVVDGGKMLPGVATIEMARATGELATGKTVTRVRQMVWARPILCPGASRRVELSLKDAEFEILDPEQGSVFTRGKVDFDEVEAPRVMDLEAIRQRCRSRIDHDEIYTRLRTFGLHLGVGFRPLKELFSNDRESLAALELPHVIHGDADRYMLHPSLMDGALQTVLGGPWGLTSNALHIPYTIGEIEILAPVTRICYAYAVPSEANPGSSNAGIERRYDAYLLDETGRELVRIKNFLLRPIHKPAPAAPTPVRRVETPAPAADPYTRRVKQDLVQMAMTILKLPEDRIAVEQ
ncbi:MAG: beta-ketoacyl synthase N-terminal-like domain-containing protein, partial [Verrucomicrobiota bacterium]